MKFFGMFQTAERTVDFVLGMLSDTARIEQNGVGIRRPSDDLIALFAQTGHDQLAIEHVHLAADGFDVQTFGHAARATWSERKTLLPGGHATDTPRGVVGRTSGWRGGGD
jgi:hypothetical protein